jgi:hypothetical protein
LQGSQEITASTAYFQDALPRQDKMLKYVFESPVVTFTPTLLRAYFTGHRIPVQLSVSGIGGFVHNDIPLHTSIRQARSTVPTCYYIAA